MTKRLLSSVLAIFLFGLTAYAQGAETDEARIPLENYIKAHATGDAAFARKAFHTEGNMVWMRDGKYNSETFDAFITRAFTGKAAGMRRSEKRDGESRALRFRETRHAPKSSLIIRP
ncbi:MAG: nuclear transport factor 2 family protein [Pyrinomonadaceae bacterium]